MIETCHKCGLRYDPETVVKSGIPTPAGACVDFSHAPQPRDGRGCPQCRLLTAFDYLDHLRRNP